MPGGNKMCARLGGMLAESEVLDRGIVGNYCRKAPGSGVG
jgi:hypothetical protein